MLVFQAWVTCGSSPADKPSHLWQSTFSYCFKMRSSQDDKWVRIDNFYKFLQG